MVYKPEAWRRRRVSDCAGGWVVPKEEDEWPWNSFRIGFWRNIFILREQKWKLGELWRLYSFQLTKTVESCHLLNSPCSRSPYRIPKCLVTFGGIVLSMSYYSLTPIFVKIPNLLSRCLLCVIIYSRHLFLLNASPKSFNFLYNLDGYVVWICILVIDNF